MTGGGSAAGSGPPPTWTILVATIGERRDLFARLLDVLLPQTEPYGGRVRVLACWTNGDPPLPQVRQALVEAARSQYVCFVDDDDLVPDYYVQETMAALDGRPDYVGWQLEYRNRGTLTAVAYHTLAVDGWYGTGGKLYRDITHLNPIRAELARRADFRKAKPGKAEDRVWADQLRGHIHTEAYIDKTMYIYLYDPAVSAWRQPRRIRRGPFRRPTVDSSHFGWLE